VTRGAVPRSTGSWRSREHVVHFFLLPLLKMLSFLSSQVFGYSIAVAGIRGGLGRELASQALSHDMRVIGLVRPTEVTETIRHPVRRGWLSASADDAATAEVIRDTRLSLHALDRPSPNYDALILCMSGQPFDSHDTMYESTVSICRLLPRSCKHIVLVSAHGVGESIRQSNVGIKVMRGWYLRETYSSKERQEMFVAGLEGVTTTILRPRVLSYGHIPFNTISTRRQDLAQQILHSVTDANSQLTRPQLQ
jgi:nucleoside-diphosphate-sugar epimerase